LGEDLGATPLIA
jgi:hypothetical protein